MVKNLYLFSIFVFFMRNCKVCIFKICALRSLIFHSTKIINTISCYANIVVGPDVFLLLFLVLGWEAGKTMMMKLEDGRNRSCLLLGSVLGLLNVMLSRECCLLLYVLFTGKQKLQGRKKYTLKRCEVKLIFPYFDRCKRG